MIAYKSGNVIIGIKVKTILFINGALPDDLRGRQIMTRHKMTMIEICDACEFKTVEPWIIKGLFGKQKAGTWKRYKTTTLSWREIV